MAIGAQALAIHPGLRERGGNLFLGPAQQMGHDGGGGHLHQQHVIEADAIKAVFQRQDALDFVSFDHGREHVTHGQGWVALGHGLATHIIGHGENAPEIIRRMAPFGGQPGVVKIEPAHQGADIEGCFDGIEHKGRPPARAIRRGSRCRG